MALDVTARTNQRDREIIYLELKMSEIKEALPIAPSIKFRAIVEGIWLSDRDSEVLALIAIFKKDRGHAPTFRQIAAQCTDRSISEACDSIQSLLKKEVIARFAVGKYRIGVTRSIRVLKPIKLEVING